MPFVHNQHHRSHEFILRHSNPKNSITSPGSTTALDPELRWISSKIRALTQDLRSFIVYRSSRILWIIGSFDFRMPRAFRIYFRAWNFQSVESLETLEPFSAVGGCVGFVSCSVRMSVSLSCLMNLQITAGDVNILSWLQIIDTSLGETKQNYVKRTYKQLKLDYNKAELRQLF